MRDRKRKKEDWIREQPRKDHALSLKGKAKQQDRLTSQEMLDTLSAFKTPADRSAASGEATLVETLRQFQRHYGNASLVGLLKNRGTSKEGVEKPEIHAKQSQGHPLDPQVRQELEDRVDQDLGSVRIHRDPEAEKSAEALHARAYTRGADIYFGKNQYDPRSPKGKALLTHELVHALQQGQRKPSSPQVSPSNHPLEREADDVVRMVQRGMKASIRSRQGTPGILRQEEEEGKKEAPKTRRHPREISPALKRGVINAGPFSIAFFYDVTEGGEVSTLVLHVPDEVGAAFSPLGGASKAGYRISDPGGTKARSVLITMGMGAAKMPKMRALFTQGAFTYVVIFQFAQ
jgi:hypothetical protein